MGPRDAGDMTDDLSEADWQELGELIEDAPSGTASAGDQPRQCLGDLNGPGAIRAPVDRRS